MGASGSSKPQARFGRIDRFGHLRQAGRHAAAVAAAGALAISTLLVLRVPTATAAGPFFVNSTADLRDASLGDHLCATAVGTCTLRAAVEEANQAGGMTVISLPPGTYDLSLGALRIGEQDNTDITIAGVTGVASDVTIRQTVVGRSVLVHNFYMYANNVLRLANLTVTGGSASSADPDGIGGYGGGLIGGAPVGNTAYIDNVVFAGNHTTGNGSAGAISWSAGGNLVITNSTFRDNFAGGPTFGDGGAIQFIGSNPGIPSSLTITDSLFANNYIAAPEGEGGAISISGWTAPVTITASTFTGNVAPEEGGAVAVRAGVLTFTGNRVVGNAAPFQSGVAVLNSSIATGQDNWWGCNAGPTMFPCDRANGDLATAPWAVLRIDAGASLIPSGGSTSVTAAMTRNSDGDEVSPSLFDALGRVPVDWTVSGGTLAGAQPYIGPAGTAPAEFSGSGCGTSGTVTAKVDNQAVSTTVLIDCPDLAITKMNDVGSTALVGQQWNWTLTVANQGTVPATLAPGQVVLTDMLDTAGVGYGSPVTGKKGLTCGIVLDRLSCMADALLSIGPGESFSVVLPVTSSSVGVVPESPSSVCVVDPDGLVLETTEANNACSDSVRVNAGSTTTTITGASPSPAWVGTVRVSYTVSPVLPASGTPTGIVTIREFGGSVVCTDAANAGYCDATFASAGSKSLVAVYDGSATFLPSVSMPFDLDVNPATTATRIVSLTPEPSVVGASVHVAFGVTSVGGTPTGEVTVSAGADTCTGTVAAGGCDIVFTSPGSKSVVAAYAGDENFLASASVAENHLVVPQAPNPTATATATATATGSASSTASAAPTTTANGTASATASVTNQPSMTPPPTAESTQGTTGGDGPTLVALLLPAAVAAVAVFPLLAGSVHGRRRLS